MRNILSSSRKHDYVRANEATSVFLEEVELVGGEPRSSHELFPSPYSSEFDDGALKPRPRRRPVNLCAWIALVLVALAFAGGLAAGLARRGEAAGGDALAISKNVSAAASSGAFGSATDETRQLCSWAGLVLPEGAIIPSAYNLTIHLRPDHFVANAQNAAGTFQGEPVSVPANQADPHLVIISFGNTSLAAGHNITLGLQYQASLGVMDGLYRSDPYAYDNPNGGEELSSVMLVTQFEEFGARKAFPCFDEPRYKAKFMLSLEVPKQYTALANMPQTSRTPSQAGSNLDMATFAASPIMSPYLVAIAVGELHGHWALTSDGKNVTVWSAPRKHHGLAYPLQIATRALDFFANWTGVAQPLLKFDLVAVPGKMGAMENWGLLLFDETRFLHDSAYSGSRGQWLSADVVCHELAHQWFGNLVTCADWTQLTVNEGVASFMEYKCLEAVAPEMSAPALFHLATTPEGEALGVHEGPHARALQADADALSQPLVIPQDAADAAFQDPAYGTIVYSKGAAVLRMLEGFWEAALPGSFQEGLQHYLVSHAYSMATTDDLLASLLHVASQGVNSASLSGPAQSSDPSDRGIQTLLDASTLVSDACALALAGQLSPEAALGIATAAAESPAADSGFGQYLLLLPVLEELQNLERLLQGNDSCIADLHKFTVRMLEGHVQRLVASLGTRIEAGPQDAFLNNLSKGNVVWAAAKAGDAAAAAALCQLFTNSSARNSLDPDWRGAAYLATVAQPHGCQQSADAKAAWSSLLAQWEGENDITTARSALYALPAAASLEALKATLDLALDLQSNHAKPASLQDAPTLVHNVAQSKAGQALAWQYLQDNWPAITAKFGTQGAYMLLAAIPFPPTQVQYDSLAAFLATGKE
ncbi:hypothetical protein WJX72_006025 [[Myrmecia] bisecta]|uniref:Aminopeptidase n=1 Tax=[Myrmecia] bisecta TaxID=41462 RepID=A0AAW1QR12_9CHLO